MSEIQQNLKLVNSSISRAAEEAQRNPEDIQIVAVTKTLACKAIRDALKLGHTMFGENRVQEAEQKWPRLREEFSLIQLHLIGALQTNKVRRAMQLFDVIETVDRESVALAIAREMDKSGRKPDCFIQVNTGEEKQKAGVLPAACDTFIKFCRQDLNLPLVGLMCIPPQDEEAGMHFGLLVEMARRNGLNKLSMGMSGDYQTAIRFGATHVRIGTAIFGKRNVMNKGVL